ncbi:MAG: GHKL domain-containing protein [Xanthomonadaceae bacterium]|nr:GHKL domain-containing protein [Xanthomonadaceae bacterium]
MKSVHEALVQAGKLSALGELSAGIAHELNQPLQGIKGYSQLLQDNVTDAKTTQEYLGEIIKNSERMAAIIRDLRSFTQASIEGFDWITLSDPISAAKKMLDGHLTAAGVRVEISLPTELPKCFANKNQFEQVFVNLFNNAKDAIIETGRSDGVIRVSATQIREGEVKLIISDNGKGMDSQTRDQIFNPFFTTKPTGKGMGLGLSVTYSIMQKHRGLIEVKSEKTSGSTFVIKLPVDFRTKKGSVRP